MKRSLLILALVVTIPAALGAQVIQSYTGTVFVPGGGENYTIWTKLRSPGWAAFQAYDAAVVLQQPHFADPIPTTQGVGVQASALRSYLNGLSGLKVLVAHSMGGLVSREVSRQSSAGIAGIVTIATPHNGSHAANNSGKITSYLNATVSRLSQSVAPALSLVLGPVIGPVVGYFAAQQIQQLRDSINVFVALPQGTLNDVKVGGGAVGTLQAYSGDASLPRGSVHGSIPVRNFPFMMLASLRDSPGAPRAQQFSSYVHSRNLVVTALKTCKVAYYVTLVFSPFGRRCSLAKKMLTRADGQLFAWVTGQTVRSTTPRAFDGIVEVSRAQYPNLSDATRKLQASGSDHFSILYDGAGVAATTQVMRSLNMTSR